MAEPKTRPTDADPHAFIAAVADPRRRRDGQAAMRLHEELTGEKPVMWGPTIVGFGRYRYMQGKVVNEWPIAGFSPRKANLTIYVMKGFEGMADRLARLGPHKSSVSCLYITDLSRIDMAVLREICAESIAWMRAKYRE